MKLIKKEAKTFGEAERKLDRWLSRAKGQKLEVWVNGQLAYRVRGPTKKEREENKSWRVN